MADLVQIIPRRLVVNKVLRGQMPCFETHLEPGQRIVHVESLWTHDYRHRRTVDWTLNVLVETRIPPEDRPDD